MIKIKPILLAGGYATRLYPLTKNKPKALLDISGKPIIDYIIEKIIEINEIDEILIVTNDKFHQDFNNWLKNFKCPIKIKILNDGTKTDETKLGAIGDVDFVIKKENINEDFLVIASDNIFNFSLKPTYESFKKTKKDTTILYDLKDLEKAKRGASVLLDQNNKVIYFEEKSPNPKSTLYSIPIYFYKKQTAKLFDQYIKEGNNPDAPGFFVQWLYKRTPVNGITINCDEYIWLDIGNLDWLKQARKLFK